MAPEDQNILLLRMRVSCGILYPHKRGMHRGRAGRALGSAVSPQQKSAREGYEGSARDLVPR